MGSARTRSPAVGLALVLGSATSVQFGAAFATTLFDDLGASGTAFLRLLFGAAILCAIWRPRLRGLAARDVAAAAGLGLSLGLMNWSFYEALDRIPLGPAVTLELLGPLAVAIAGSRRPLDAVWILLALAGVVLLGNPFGGGGLDPAGVALALFAAACWAAYILLAARVGAVFSGGHGLAIGLVVAAIVVLPAGVSDAGDALLVPGLLASAVIVALLASVIPYSFELEALRRIPTSLFGLLMSLEPAIAAFAGLVVLGQHLEARELVAIALVVCACAGAALETRTPRPVEI